MSLIVRRVASRLLYVFYRLALFSFDASLVALDVAGTLLNAATRGTRQPRAQSVPVPFRAVSPGDSVTSVEARQRDTFLPIVFIHQSNSDYLKYSLGQAQTSNARSTIYLLGDSLNNAYDGIEHRHFADYSQQANYFTRLYRHYSTHTPETELFWFQRWFILREFLHVHRLQQCLYLDSDTMLYADVTADAKKFARFDFTLCWNTIGCVFFMNRLEGLDAFCQFVLDIYSKKDRYHYDKMVSHYAVRQRNGLDGGAGDMTAFQLYSEAHFGCVGEAGHVIDGSFYDPNINMPHPGLEMDGKLKKVTWKNGQPFGRYLRTGEEIKFNSMHFQGAETKKFMGQHLSHAVKRSR